jgi:tetratricopeptide (TPR) repeat protein
MLFLFAIAGGILLAGQTVTRPEKFAAVALLLFALGLLTILANSGADYAGVRHAMAVYFVLAPLAGIALRYLLSLRSLATQCVILGLAALSLVPALAVLRPWEYHNILVGGTVGAYRYFRNDSVSLGQRDREIADYYHRKIEPTGEVPLILFAPTLIKYDLKQYRHLRLKALDDPESDEIPPASVTGTIFTSSESFAPAMWSDLKALREAQPLDRFGNLFVFRGSFYLPNLRADALFDRADELLNEPKPNLDRVAALLKEGLELRRSDYFGWLLLGNLYVLRRDPAQAEAAYGKALAITPPGALQQAVETQIRSVQTQPIDAVMPMRNPGVE